VDYDAPTSFSVEKDAPMKAITRRQLVVAAALSLPLALLALDAATAQRGYQPPRYNPPTPQPPRYNPPTPQPPRYNPPQYNPPQPPRYNPPQPPHYNPPQPQYNPPQQVWVTVWSCSRCGRELAQGDARPSIAVCPYCGANLSGVAMQQAVANRESSSSTSSDAAFVAVFLLGMGGFVAVVLGIVLYVCLRKPSRPVRAQPQITP
jgi:hypothetical protein